MRPNLILSSFFLIVFSVQISIYDIQVDSIIGETISMVSFTNKKIIISPFNASNPDIGWLQYLDSIENADTSLRVIVVPANDLGGAGNDADLAALKDSLSLNVLMLKQAYVKKNAGDNQHPLFKWLTDVNENSHFDMDVESPGQMFIVSGSGVLYSVLGEDVPANILSDVLQQNIE